ncbi:MAG: outer membrane protein assembly factor BamA [Nitrospira sp.]|nr:outer membrane protein assembly factor BamA [Nitrospira sp.]
MSLPEKNLKEVMSLKEGGLFNSDLIEADRDGLQAFYNALGYLDSRVEEVQTHYDEQAKRMDITMRINEGSRTEIGKVEIVGTKLIAEEEVRRVTGIRPGDPYNEVDISNARYRVIDLYSTHGLSGTTVSVKKKIEEQKAFLTFQIDEGEVTYFGKTVITGNDNTKHRVIERELLHRKSMPLDYRLLSKNRQKLYKLGLFTDVDLEVIDSYDNQKDVLIKLKEGRAGAIEFGLGYGDYEGPRGFVDLSYRNLWGMNRQASLRLEMSSLEKRILLQFYEPWFLDTRTSFRAFFLRDEREERDIDTRETRYRLRRHTASAGLEKQLSEKLKAQLYYEFSVNKTFDVQPDVVLSRKDVGTVIISGITPGLIYDTRDNPFDPRKGVLSGISLKFTSPLFFSESNFFKLTLQGSNFQSLTRWLVLAMSLRGGIAEGYSGTDELPIVERFFLGGRTTVRGYKQDSLGPKGADGNPTGGNAFLCGNLELRTYLGKGLGFVTFLDGGNVWLKTNDVDLEDVKYTVGLGLRYSTPVGPIRIDYGHKLDREPGESRGEIHFYIGHAF